MTARRHRLGLSSWILIGAIAGVGCGVFFGEYCAPLGIVGDVFIALLQMAVLPYVVVALVANIGRLSVAGAWSLARSAGLVVLLLWAVGLVTIAVMPWSWPGVETASFFNATFVEARPPVDMLALYVPSNPFYSLANNLVPAVVLFCICLGIGLIGVAGKEGLIAQLDILAEVLMRVNGFFVRLTPVGVFAIAANAAGTMSVRELGSLQGYLITYSLAALILTFWVLPALVSACTPFRYRDVLAAGKDAMVTAFAVGKTFVVLPLLIDRTAQLLRDYEIEGEEVESAPEVVIPLTYPFPNVGKLLALIFVPFAAWFSGAVLAAGQYPTFLGAGLLVMFGSPTIGIPFLLDLMHLPEDTFPLFLLSGVITMRMGDLAGTMHLLALTLLSVAVIRSRFRPRLRALVVFFGVWALLVAGAVVGTRAGLKEVLRGQYDKDRVLAGMQLVEGSVATVVLEVAAPNPVSLAPGQSRFERARARGVLRVGFEPDSLPFVYFNDAGALVGFDVDMAHRLARELELTLEFVPFTSRTLQEQLAADHFDLAMSGVAGTSARSGHMLLSRSYLDVHAALVVRDHRRHEFESGAVVGRRRLRIGALANGYFAEAVRLRFPELEVVELASHGVFFDNPDLDLDALACSAEAGSVWTLRYPHYKVVKPRDVEIAVPLVYPIGGSAGTEAFAEFLDHWIELKQKDGTVADLHAHWILGRDAEPAMPRWSVIRDVLHWVD